MLYFFLFTLRSDLSQTAMMVTLAAQNKDMSIEIRLGNQFSCYSARQTPDAQQALLLRLAVIQIQDSEAIPIMFYLIHELEGRENYLIHERLFDKESTLLIQRSPESIPHDSIIYRATNPLLDFSTYQLFELRYQPTGGCLKEEELDFRTAQPSFLYLEKVNKAYIQPLWGLLTSLRADPSKSLQDQASALANAITVALRGPKSSGSGSFVELTSLRPVRQLLENRVKDQRQVTKRTVDTRNVFQVGHNVDMDGIVAALLVSIDGRSNWQAWDARRLRYFLQSVYWENKELERASENYRGWRRVYLYSLKFSRFARNVDSERKVRKYTHKMLRPIITVGMRSAILLADGTVTHL